MTNWFFNKLWTWFGLDFTKSQYADMPEALAALHKALECGSSVNNLKQGAVLQVEELPSWMFNGEPIVVARNSDGVVFDVVMSYYDKELKGEVVTVQADAKNVFYLNRPYFDLKPGEYTVVAVHNEKMP